MPRLNEIFPSKFLKAADLNNREVKVTIDRVVNEEVGQDGDRRWVAYFQNADKGLVLNKTNADTIAMIVGDDDTDNWTGQTILLFPTMTQYQGRPVEAIRVTKVRQSGAQGQPAQQRPPAANVQSGRQEPQGDDGREFAPIDDDIPF